jgi:hypothetical protein
MATNGNGLEVEFELKNSKARSSEIGVVVLAIKWHIPKWRN